MTAETLTAILANIDTGPNYVPPFSAYMLGRKAYRARLDYEMCVTDEMRSGWLAAEGDTDWAQRSTHVVHHRNRVVEHPGRHRVLGGVPGGE